MEKNHETSRFRFLNYIIKKSELEFTGEIKSTELNLSITPTIEYYDKLYKLTLNVVVTTENNDFKASIEMMGVFEYETSDRKQLNIFFAQSAPAIMFPYIRAYIHSLTALSGIPGVMIPTLNLTNMGKDIIKELS